MSFEPAKPSQPLRRPAAPELPVAPPLPQPVAPPIAVRLPRAAPLPPPIVALPPAAAPIPMAELWGYAEPSVVESPQVVEPKFCGRCGAAWVPGKLQCVGCGRALDRIPTVEEISAADDQRRVVEQTIRRDQSSLKSALWLYFVQLAICIVMLGLTLADGGDLPLAWFFGADVAMALVTLCWACVRWSDVRPLLVAKCSPVWFVVAPLCAIFTFAAALAVVRVLSAWAGIPEVTYVEAFQAEGYGFGWAVLSICVMPAIFEEIAFRGVILEALGGFLKRGEAVLVSALLFAILHLSIPSIPHLCLMGVILAQLRYVSGSIVPGILMHFTHNLLVILAETDGNGLFP
ncbi:MAG: type II CAAX endopeptidase family protein [Pirellulales bacterium]